MTDAVNLAERFSRFSDQWHPKIVGELNDSYIKLAKVQGEFVWHQHANEDEFFLVVQGRLLIRLRDRDVLLNEGEFFVVPRGVEHLPVAEDEAHILLLEPKATLHTGDVDSARTVAVEDQQWLE